MMREIAMCLGEVGRVVRLVDERTAVVECAGREITAALDVLLADGGAVDLDDVVVVSMGFVLATTTNPSWSLESLSDQEEVRR